MEEPRYCPPFVPMASVLTAGTVGRWHLDLFHSDAEEVKSLQLRSVMSFCYGDYYDLVPGDYVRLHDGRDTMMTDTPMERRTNREFVDRAHGDVLVGGLGIGMVVCALALKRTVQSVVVLEKDFDILTLVGPQVLEWWSNNAKAKGRLEILAQDAFTYTPLRSFHSVWMDIWPTISGDNWPQMKDLRKRYARWLVKDKTAFYGAWRSRECQQRAAEDRALDRAMEARR